MHSNQGLCCAASAVQHMMNLVRIEQGFHFKSHIVIDNPPPHLSIGFPPRRGFKFLESTMQKAQR